MMTPAECLAKAADLDRLGRECVTQEGRQAFAQLVQGWRRNAMVLRQQEAWEKLRSAH